MEIGQSRMSVAELAKRTGLNRTTVYRILSTLEADGFLIRSPSNHEYRLSSKVRLLSDGYTDPFWITQLAAPILMKLLRDTSWPGSLASFDGRNMVIRETTHRFSSFFIHKPMIGQKMPMSSALGQAFLAFSGNSVRQPLLNIFIDDWVSSDFGHIDTAKAKIHLAKVKKDGFAIAFGSAVPDVGAIAMPIMRNGQVLACMNIVMSSEAFHASQILNSIRKNLRHAVSALEADIQQFNRHDFA